MRLNIAGLGKSDSVEMIVYTETKVRALARKIMSDWHGCRAKVKGIEMVCDSCSEQVNQMMDDLRRAE